MNKFMTLFKIKKKFKNNKKHLKTTIKKDRNKKSKLRKIMVF